MNMFRQSYSVKYCSGDSDIFTFAVQLLLNAKYQEVCFLLANLHEAIMPWKRFPRYWRFVMDYWYLLTKPVIEMFDVFHDVNLNQAVK